MGCLSAFMLISLVSMWLIQLTLPLVRFLSPGGATRFWRFLVRMLSEFSVHFLTAAFRLISILYNYAAYSANASFSSTFIRQGRH